MLSFAFFGKMYTETEMRLPEFDIDGVTILVLFHSGVMTCTEFVCGKILDKLSAADTGAI